MADTVTRSALSAGLVALYEETYRLHANGAGGVCPIDGEADCQPGQLAWQRLVLAGAVRDTPVPDEAVRDEPAADEAAP